MYQAFMSCVVHYRIQSVAAAPEKENEFGFINNLPRPRFIKSHLPLAFLPRGLWTAKPKIVYVAREAKDAAVSFYHHYYNLYQYHGGKEDFLDLFLQGESKSLHFVYTFKIKIRLKLINLSIE